MCKFLLVGLSAALLAACAPVHPEVKPDEVISRASAGGSDAVVLSRSGWLVVENAARGPYTLEVRSRTLVLSKSGIRLSKLAIPLSERSDLLEFSGRTVLANGTVLSIGKSAVRVQEDKLVVELPQVEVGSVIEYRYKIRCNRALERLRFDFQASLPIVRSSFTVVWPKWARLGYELVNLPAGQPAEPDVRSGHGPGIPDFARISWRLVDLGPSSPGTTRASIILGLKDEAYEKRLAQRESWGGGIQSNRPFDTHQPRARNTGGLGAGLPASASASHSGRPINK